MASEMNVNRRIILNSRPVGAPTLENFRLEKTATPVPADGQVLLRTLYLSLDPYMRGRMSDAPSYAPPVEIGAVMIGGTVSRVERSLHPDYQAGDLVLSFNGWQDYALSDGTGLTRVDPHMPQPSLSLLTRTLLTKRLKMQGFIIFDDYDHRYGEFSKQMSTWVQERKIKFREDLVAGLENAPQAFIGLLEGKNFGKLVIQMAQG